MQRKRNGWRNLARDNDTITRAAMMTPMLDACPSFFPVWEGFLAEWADDPKVIADGGLGAHPTYLALSDLADHIIRKLEAGDTADFPAIFSVIERWIIDGDSYVSEAAIVGLLEDLTSKHRFRTASPQALVQWLGPQSKKWWAEVIGFWERLESGSFKPLSIN